MDLTAALSLVGLLFVTLLAITVGYVVILLLLEHAKYDHLPGPKRTSFFLGNVVEIAKTTRSPQDCKSLPPGHKDVAPLPNEKFVEWFDVYGDTYVLFFMHKALIVTRSQSFLKMILVDGDQKDFGKSTAIKARYVYGTRIFGEGLATAADHDAWYLRRKVADPMFRRNRLVLAIETFNSSGDQFITELQRYAESGQTCELADFLQKSTLDVIVRAMFSIETADLTTALHKATTEFVEVTFAALQLSFVPFVEYNPLFYAHRRKVDRVVKAYRDVGTRIILARKVAICNGEVVPHDLLTTLVKAHLAGTAGYDFDILVDEFVTMIVAGMETTGNTLGFIFMELGRRPDLVHRLVREVDEVVGQKSFISNDDITKLTFTTTLIKETLRMYSTAPTIMRHCRKETTVDGIRVPAHSEILVNLVGANNNSKYVDKPAVFDPDRFHPNKEKRVPIYSFLSFSLGSRSCIGQVFAQMEMKVLLAKFFQHYNLRLDDSETFLIGQNATHFPINRVKCTVTHRH